MHIDKDEFIENLNIDEIDNDIIDSLINTIDDNCNISKLEDIDYFIENVSFIQQGKKCVLEGLSYTKYKLKEYLVSFYYGLESFSYNQNSFGIMYSILSLMQLRLYEQAEYIFNQNKEKIIDIINSNKFDINEFIDILIYFNIPITDIDDIGSKLELLKNKQLKYIYILINIMNDKRISLMEEIQNEGNIIKESTLESYTEYLLDASNILRELGLHNIEEIYKLIINNYDKDIKYLDMLPCDNLPHHIEKKLLDIIQINIENNNYIPYTINNYNYEDNFIKIISYQSKSLVSMHILKFNDEYIIIDCGAEIINGKINKIDISKKFKENGIDTNKIKALIISHAHLDHYGSIELIQPYVEKIYMTKDTYNIINIVGKENFIDTKKLVLKKDYDEFWIDNFKIKFLSNNHIKGSVAVFIEKDNKKILYTGDFSFNRQTTTKYVDENDFYKFNNIDYLITETTYGNKDIELPYRYKKKLINYFINLSVKNNIKVIIPAFAIGRAQECYDLIKNSTIKANILVDGLATKVNEYYGSINNIGNNKSSNIYNKYISNDIIIASGGILNEGSASEKYYNIALKDENMVTVLKCGYMDKDIYDIKIKPYDGININLIDISFSAHATYEDLLKMVKVTKPKNLVQVHGNGIKLYNDLLYKKDKAIE